MTTVLRMMTTLTLNVWFSLITFSGSVNAQFDGEPARLIPPIVNPSEDTNPGRVASSSDGQVLAFSAGGPLSLPGLPALIDPGSSQVFLADRATGTFELASVTPMGGFQNGGPELGPISMSRDGRYVAFGSLATNLDPNALVSRLYLFVYDRMTRSVRALDWDLPSSTGAISGDGSYVVFWCRRAPGPGGGSSPNDLCIRPVSGGAVRRFTIGAVSSGISPPVVSGNGRWILFAYRGASLVPTLMNPPDRFQLYMLDLTTGGLEMVTRSAEGEPGDLDSGYIFNYAINYDGDFVAFSSVASNLIPGISTGRAIVVKQRSTGTYRLASPNGFAGAFVPRLSDDGRRVFYLDYTGFFANQLGFVYDWNTNRRRSITGPIQGATTGRICQGSLFLGGPPAEALVQTIALSGDGRWAYFSHHADVPFTPSDPCQLYVRNLGPVPSEPVGVPAVSPGWVILFAGMSFLVAVRALRKLQK